MQSHSTRTPRRSVGAFTLIELLVVLIIIAALAALIVPNIGMFGRSTDMAVSAKTQGDIANQVQLFFVTQKRYPQGLDSLLDTTGALYAPAPANAETQTVGLPYAGADNARLAGGTDGKAQLAPLTVTKLGPTDIPSLATPDYYRSITRSGFDWVYDHDTGVTQFEPLEYRLPRTR